jgi:glycosyltransferase involved in cell wall biosynthesis
MAQVSVITASYNRAHTIVRAIESVRGQTFSDWQHIIVDDGSTDDTMSVALPYLRKDPRLSYRRTSNKGPASAMNTGICLAKTPFVAFLDSDDEFAPKHLQLRLEYFASHPEVDLVWGGLRAIGPRSRQFVLDAAGSGRRLHLSACRVCGTLVGRRAVIHRARGFRKLVSCDYDLCQRLAAMGARIDRVHFQTLLCHVAGDDRMTMRTANVDDDGSLIAEPDSPGVFT